MTSYAAAGSPTDAVPTSIRLGAIYRYVCPEPRHAFGCRYQVVQFSIEGRTKQEQVLHVGLEGADRGRYFSCTPANFAVRFEEVVPEKPPETVVEPPPAPAVLPAALDDLRRHCRDLASRQGEPVLLVTEPPTGIEYNRHLPYGVLESQADDRERQAATERFEPKGARP